MVLQEAVLNIKKFDSFRIMRSSQSEQKNMPNPESLMKYALHITDDWNNE
jgi:hypothetical protein